MTAERTLVVGAAIVRRGRVLAARRTRPAEAAGRWEFAGGKRHPGETRDAALEREVGEELGCEVVATRWLPGAVPIRDGHELQVALARLVDGEPTPTEHDELRWLRPHELGDVDWLEPDRPFLAAVRAELEESAAARGLRAIFFDEEDAEAVVARLAGEGYEAWLERERLAGEDDDEDHPWAVISDAPELLLEMLVDEFDGWLDRDEPARPAAAPLELPGTPKRVKRGGVTPCSGHTGFETLPAQPPRPTARRGGP